MSMLKQFFRRVVPRRINKRLQLLRYRGDNRECPCCGGRFSTFWPSGVNNKPDTLCPKCSSLERHRLMWLWFARKSGLGTKPAKLLHIAPEPLFTAYFKSLPNIEYVSADLDSPLAMLKMDLTDIKQPDGAFDVIVCSHVLEHIRDDAKAMRELRRILKSNGWAILQVPVDNTRTATYEDWSITTPAQRLLHFGQEDHVRIYGQDYKARLEEAGFEVRVDRLPAELGSALTTRYGLQDDEDVYFCK